MMGFDAISLSEFKERQQPEGWLPLQQSAEYAAALRLAGGDVTLLAQNETIVSMVQRRWAGCVSLRSIMRADVPMELLRELKPRWPGMLLHSKRDVIYLTEESEGAFISPTYHVWCDVQKGLQPHPKWERNLERVPDGLSIKQEPWNSASAKWLVAQEEVQQFQQGYKAIPAGFVEAYVQAGGKARLFVAYQKKERIAAQLCLRHGNSATYWMGVSNELGREAFAHYALLAEMMDYLRERGTRWLDLGAVDTVKNAGLARFKLGTRGVVTSTGGTWLV